MLKVCIQPHFDVFDLIHCVVFRVTQTVQQSRNLDLIVTCHYKVDQENWHQPQQPVVLRTWNMESPHNYENSRHETSIFACPGTTSFEVEFDERCETEKR